MAGAACKVALPFLAFGKGYRASPSAQHALPLQQPRLLKRMMERQKAGHRHDSCYRSSHRKLCCLIFPSFLWRASGTAASTPPMQPCPVQAWWEAESCTLQESCITLSGPWSQPASHPKPPHGPGLLLRKATHHIPPVLGLKGDQRTGSSSPDQGSSGVQQPH